MTTTAFSWKRVTDPSGRPVTGSVHARRALLTNADSQQLDPATGAFAFGPMPAEDYDLSAWIEGYGSIALGAFAVLPGQERGLDDIALREPGDVELTVFDAAGRPAEAARSGLRTEHGQTTQGCAIRGGRGQLAKLQPGHYFFECDTGGGRPRAFESATAEFDVVSGATTRVELRAQAAVRVTVLVRDPAPRAPELAVAIWVRDTSGSFRAFAKTHPRNAEPLAQQLRLPAGTFRLDCRATDGRRAEADVTIRSLDQPVEVTVDLPQR